MKKPLFEKRIVLLALPLILSHISVPLVGLVNTILAGHLDNALYLAAIGLGTMIFNFLFWGLGFFRVTTTGLIAKAHGAHDNHDAHSALWHSLFLATVIGCGVIILQIPIERFFLLFIHPTAKVLSLLHTYYGIRIWSTPAVLINFVLVGAFIGVQKTRGPLITLTITNVLSILLSIIFVLVLHLHLAGIAAADLIAQYIGLAIGLYLLSYFFNYRLLFSHIKFDTNKLVTLLHANKNIFIRTLCLIAVFSFFTIWSGHISPLILAVNTLLMNFFQFMMNALGGFDNVSETLSGEAVGKQDPVLFKQNIFAVGRWSLLCSLFFALVYGVFGRFFIGLMTNIPTVNHAASLYLWFVTLLPVISFPSFTLDGVAIGANLFKAMRNSMIGTLVIFFVIWYALRSFQNTGLWLAFYSFFIFRAVFLGIYVNRFYRKLCKEPPH